MIDRDKELSYIQGNNWKDKEVITIHKIVRGREA